LPVRSDAKPADDSWRELTGFTDHDIEITGLTACQLRTFEHLRLFASHYVSRIVDHISFPTAGQQMCRREIHLTLPKAPGVAADEQKGPLIVSLGQFRRRRLADFTVTDGHGKRLNLLSRRQHGYVIALVLLRLSFNKDEWLRLGRDKSLHRQLDDLRRYLAHIVTSIVPNDAYTTWNASEQLRHLLNALGAEESRCGVEATSFQLRCDEALRETTDYLCWVDATPGDMIQLHATYTQPESPQPTHERPVPDASSVPPRHLKEFAQGSHSVWRNLRHSLYRRAKMMPVRYVFPTPAFMACRSYYFLLTPATGTEILLLDWDLGHRYSPDQASAHLTSTTEVETAGWAYHFHNHRVAQRRRPDRRQLVSDASVERCVSGRDRRHSLRRHLSGQSQDGVERRGHERRNRRQPDAHAGALLHAFVRSEQLENGKLIAIGLMSLGLAILAERGVLQTAANETASQILLLAPAALVLLVDQHNRHHFASLTRVYRSILWTYIVLAVIFATSVVFSIRSVPLFSTNTTILVPRVASGAFAIASGLLAFAFTWAGPYFAVSNKWRYKHAIKRRAIFGTTSRIKVWFCYRWRPRHWTQSQPLSDTDLIGSRDTRGSHEIYAKLARHSADRLVALIMILFVLTVTLMLRLHWGRGEACAIMRVHAEQVATDERLPFSEGTCQGGNYIPGDVFTHPSKPAEPKFITLKNRSPSDTLSTATLITERTGSAWLGVP
jgi:hypothetical protein